MQRSTSASSLSFTRLNSFHVFKQRVLFSTRDIVGLLLIAISWLCFALLNVFVKFVPDLPSAEFLFIRSFLQIIVVDIWSWRAHIPIWGPRDKFRLNMARGIVNSVNMYLNLCCLSK